MFIVIICLHGSLFAASGAPGQQGPQGSVGAVGIKGPAGLAGPRGVTGAVGVIGAAGPRGVRGIAGGFGLFGPNGSRGPQGAQGPRGDSSVDEQKKWDTGLIVLTPFSSCNSVCAQHANAVNPGWSYACVGAKWEDAYVPCSAASLFPVYLARCMCWMVTR